MNDVYEYFRLPLKMHCLWMEILGLIVRRERNSIRNYSNEHCLLIRPVGRV